MHLLATLASLQPPCRATYPAPNPYCHCYQALCVLSLSPQVGACIVDQNQVICGIGYNGFPRGCSDVELPWAKKSRGGDPLQTKYPYVCHAEMNAILNKNGASVAGAVRAACVMCSRVCCCQWAWGWVLPWAQTQVRGCGVCMGGSIVCCF